MTRSIHPRSLLLLGVPFGVVGVTALSLLGSPTPNHTPPPSEFGEIGQAAASARDEPESDIVRNLERAGQRAQAKITVRNHGLQPVDIQRIETSCPCLRVEPVSLTVGPSESAEIGFAFDPSPRILISGVACRSK